MAFSEISRRHPRPRLPVSGLARENELLREEVAQLTCALTSRAVIDQAIGAVVTLGRIAPEDAWQVLRDVSQHTNTKVRTVAEHVLKFAQGGALPDPELDELRKALGRRALRFRGGGRER
ncbi:ANTAR domain-containing protein [Streptomyces sp. NPDC096152]|uniref:ANTAR domain-containing protein n=1 Tax=Streptomyces sp. NPDC096152 TaxID=3366078 RepID=UPI003811B106